MSKEVAIKFFHTGMQSSTIQQQLRSLDMRTEADQQKLIDVASKEGYQFSVDDFRAAVRVTAGRLQKAGSQPRELAASELEAVAEGLKCNVSCEITSCWNSLTLYCY